jgi:Family of unknown function (DUF6298)/Protein of unknown function (DUF4038)/Putative collagen-binding domain of a collagenase
MVMAFFGGLALTAFVSSMMVLGLVHLLLSGCVAAPPQRSGPLRILASNPRYFTDGSGKAIYLTGSHNWNTFQVWQLDLSPRVDYNSYLSFLKNHDHNYIRLWVADSAWNSSDANFIEPQPFQRTGPGFAADGRLKFDLTKLNQAYFDQLRQQVISAKNNGIYVGVMLFNVWGVGRYNPYSVAAWKGSPFHDGNNINGISADTNGDGKGLEVHSLDDPAITAIQEAYVRKVLETLNDLDNVIYEIMNEGLGTSISWQYHFLNFVRAVESSLPQQHLVGMTGGDFPNHHLLKSSADWISPINYGPEDTYSDNPPATNGSQVSLLDTDHTSNNAAGGAACCWADSKWVWRSFTRGHSPIYMDPMDPTQSNGIDSRHQHKATEILSARNAMGHTLKYAKRMNLAAMVPSTSLCSTTYCLVNPSNEYLIYQPNSGSFTVNIQSATYAYEWFNPATGSVAGTGSIEASSGNRSFTPPFSGPAVLYLRKWGRLSGGDVRR